MERDAPCEVLTTAQEDLQRALDNAMDAYLRGNIQVEAPALPEVMYEFAKTELPEMCAGDSSARRKVLQRMRLFLKTMDLVVNPTERHPPDLVSSQ